MFDFGKNKREDLIIGHMYMFKPAVNEAIDKYLEPLQWHHAKITPEAIELLSIISAEDASKWNDTSIRSAIDEVCGLAWTRFNLDEVVYDTAILSCEDPNDVPYSPGYSCSIHVLC